MALDKHRAPYNFVPVSPHVFLPPWSGLVSHDVPLADGLRGSFELRITAETPMFVRGAHDKERFFQLPDGRKAIPGSGLKGALRGVVEIASFGWMRLVNDHRYGVRDLKNPELYVRHMADIGTTPDGKKRPMPRVVAGWLRRNPEHRPGEGTPEAFIHPCHFAKMEYRHLLVAAGAKKASTEFRPHDKQSAVDKYRAWAPANLRVMVAVSRLRPPGFAVLPYDFGEVMGPGDTRGVLVFTGQPQQANPNPPPRAPGRGGGPGPGQPKHHDFVFYGEPGPGIPVDESTFRDFEFVHGDRGQQNRLDGSVRPNEEWGHFKPDFEAGRDVPVFFLCRGGQGADRTALRAFGLAQMFRLACDHTTLDGVRNAQPGLKGPEAGRPDLAETMFGYVGPRMGDDTEALRGRVRVGAARLVGGGAELTVPPVVLAAPKASYYPAYVEQDPRRSGGAPLPGHDRRPAWRTWMDKDVRVRGWKRYRVRDATWTPPPPTGGQGQALDLAKTATTFHPLAKGAVFHAPVHVHNLRPVELGALVWAITWGGDAAARHQLGLGKPLGYGRCRLEITSWSVSDLQGRPVPESSCQRAFTERMETFWTQQRIPGVWEGSEQLRTLLELARPVSREAAAEHRYMLIRRQGVGNEFQEAKADGLQLPHPLGADDFGVARDVSQQVVSPAGAGQRPQGGVRPPSPQFPIRGGTVVPVVLTGKTGKGKWRAQLKGGAGAGVMQGDPPSDACEGFEADVIVVAGGNPKDMQFKWP